MELGEKNSIFFNSTSTLPNTILEIHNKLYVDSDFIDHSIIKNNAHVDFFDKNLDYVRFVKLNSMTEVGEHLTAKSYVDIALF